NGDIFIKDIKGGNAPNMVPDKAEALLVVKDRDSFTELYNKYKKEKNYPVSLIKEDDDFRVIATGISAHGSTPEKGINAISYLFDFLGYVLDDSNPIYDFVKLYNERIAFKHNGENIGAGLEDDVSGKLNFNPG